jgi:casein kinase 1
VNASTKEQVAVKFEDLAADCPQLEQEAAMLESLRWPAKQQGFAEYFHSGKEGHAFCLVMEFLGKSLEDRVELCGGRLTPKTTALVAEQALQRIEYLHSKGIIHRDIKPENFMFGARERQHHLYLIDFGLSKKYYDKKHSKMYTRLPLTGTARYASVNAHKGLEQSRRDDLEAIGHMLIYFVRGSLPWSGLTAKNKEEKYKRIKEVKESTPIADLCQSLPREFERFLTYCRGLGFQERPDYVMLRRIFGDMRGMMSREEGRDIQDHEFEWNIGKDVGLLEPLAPAANFSQPDDTETAPKGRGLGGFFRR